MKKRIKKTIVSVLTVMLVAFCVACKPSTGGVNSTPATSSQQQQQGTFIKFSEKELTIEVGETYQLKIFSSANANDIEWITTNSEVVTVENGKIFAVQVGKASIIASLGEFDKAVCEVTVSAGASMAYSLKLNRDEVRLNVGETFSLTGQIRYGSEIVPNANMIWTSSNVTVATVDNQGKVTPLAYGTTDITAKCVLANGTVLESVCTVSVIENYVLKIMESENGVFVKPGESFRVTPKLYDENGNELEMDTTMRTFGVVNQRLIEGNGGVFTALATGKTQVYVEYRGIIAYCDVDVWGITAEDFSIVSGVSGTGVIQERNSALLYTGVAGVAKETRCGVVGEKWKDFVANAIGYGYTTLVVTIFEVDGVLLLNPDGVANSVFDVEKGTTLTTGEVSYKNPCVAEKSLIECQNWLGIYLGTYGNGSFAFEITVK